MPLVPLLYARRKCGTQPIVKVLKINSNASCPSPICKMQTWYPTNSYICKNKYPCLMPYAALLYARCELDTQLIAKLEK